MSNKIIFPQSLKKGDAIGIVSPAGSVTPEQLTKGLDLIKSKGYEAVLAPHVLTNFNNGYNYSGTEEQRSNDLNWALNDNNIKAAWASRGGYGCQHVVPHLHLKEFIKHPKWYIGYSDNTVVQSYLLQKNTASIHAQTIKTSSFGVSDESYELVFDILEGNFPKYTIDDHALNRTGKAKGVLVGGNLALIYALLGTKYSFDFEDKILFIEEVAEKYYSLDRMMMSLKYAGVFKKIKGLIIGGMTNMGEAANNELYEESYDSMAYQLIYDRVKDYDFPMVFGFPNGHIYDNRPLIIGAEVSMNVKDRVEIKLH